MRYVTRFHVTAAFVTIAVLFGGGGSRIPLPELVVQLTALVALCAWALIEFDDRRPIVVDRLLWIGVALLAVIPLAQLVPLPPAIWQNLPGRGLERAALDLVGAGGHWYPVSVAPYRTLASLLSLLPPITMVYFVSQLDIVDRTRLLGWVTVLVLFTAVWGVLQIAGGESNAFRMYAGTATLFETGLQANRNSTADVLMIGIVTLSAFGVLKFNRFSVTVARLLIGAVGAFLALSVVLTGSRAGTALLLVCATVVLSMLRPKVRISRAFIASAVVGLVAVVAVGAALRNNVAIERTWQRFAERPDQRPDLWQDTRFAIATYWPVGSGVGTFTTVFPASERLEVVRPTIANRAHNDFLEFALEAGLFGCLAIAAAFLASGYRLIAILRGGLRRPGAVHAIAGAGIIGILALHSLVDYPMRSMSLAVLTGFAVSLLSRSHRQNGEPNRARGAPVMETF